MKLSIEEAVQLFLENEKLAAYAVTRYFGNNPPELLLEMEEEARQALWTAVLKYDPVRGKFSTFAVTLIRNALYRWLRQTKGERRLAASSISLFAPVATDSEGNELTLADTLEAPGNTELQAEHRETASRLKLAGSTTHRQIDQALNVLVYYLNEHAAGVVS